MRDVEIVPSASYASVRVEGPGTAYVGHGATDVTIGVASSATVTVDAQATSLIGLLQGAGASLVARGIETGSVQAAFGAYADVTFVASGPGNSVRGILTGTVSAAGPRITATANSLGTVTINGPDASCVVQNTGTLRGCQGVISLICKPGRCVVSGDRARVTATGIRAYAQLAGGSGGTIVVANQATGLVRTDGAPCLVAEPAR